MTRLFTTLYRGEDAHAPVYGAGELYFKLKDAPSLFASVEVEDASSWRQKLAAAYTTFTSFAYGALRDEYLRDIRFFYDTQYDNLVLAGALQGDDGPAPFFLASGAHDRGFPGETTSCSGTCCLPSATATAAGSVSPSPTASWRDSSWTSPRASTGIAARFSN
jgi:hypothetical protein